MMEDSDNGSVQNMHGRPKFYPSTQMPPKGPSYKNMIGSSSNNVDNNKKYINPK